MDIYRIAPEGDWIVDQAGKSPASPPPILPDAPFYFLLADDQDRVGPLGIERYRRTLEHVLDASRLEDASLIVHELESTHEQLIIHRLLIIRDGEVIDALDAQNIKVLQREAELERHITNQRHTVSLSIDDLRVGDIIDHATTLSTRSGSHPLQGRHYRSRFLLSWGCPVVLQTLRLLNNGSQALRIQECRYQDGRFLRKNSRLEPAECFEMTLENPPLFRIDDSAPEWFWPDHLWVVSDTEWPDLSAYLWSVYRQEGVLEDDLELTGEILGDSADPEQQILAAIDFVQNSVRYKGEHHGIFSHLPHAAGEVLKKRSGDCKDKSNLLRAILLRLGVPASMVLVDTRRGKVLPDIPPSLYHFDHMIVRLHWQGKDYYIDPTVKKQAGDLEHRALPDVYCGLPLVEQGEGLCPIPWDLSREVYHLQHVFDFTSSEDSGFFVEVLREYRFHRADNMRYHFQSNEKNRLEQDFLGYALNDTELELKMMEPIHVVEDDSVDNRLLTRERYRILSPPRNEENQANIFTDFINEFVQPPQTRHPVRIDLEGCLRHEVEVRYRKGYDASEEEKIECPWFAYSDRIWTENNTIRFVSTLQPLSREVEEADFAAFSEAVESLRSRSGNRFNYGNRPPRTEQGFWRRAFSYVINFAIAASLIAWAWSRFG